MWLDFYVVEGLDLGPSKVYHSQHMWVLNPSMDYDARGRGFRSHTLGVKDSCYSVELT